jgi:site-specific DNA-methyltransferase (adenine-specific)
MVRRRHQPPPLVATGMVNPGVERAPQPYYDADGITVYLGDCRTILPLLDLAAVDVVIADPPYGETSLAWDRWPEGWPATMATVAASLWCFGSFRTFLEHQAEFAGWTLSQDLVWCKQNGTSFTADRFRRVHEHALHWYRGPWSAIYHQTPRIVSSARDKGYVHRQTQPPHTGKVSVGAWTDDGTRLMPSVIEARNLHRNGALHPTQKPAAILMPLIQYSCPPGGLVLDPFAGSGSTLLAARIEGRQAIGIEIEERWCEATARRLAQGVLL